MVNKKITNKELSNFRKPSINYKPNVKKDSYIKDNSRDIFNDNESSVYADNYNDKNIILDLSKLLKTCFKIGQVFSLLIIGKTNNKKFLKQKKLNKNQHNSHLIIFNNKVHTLVKYCKELQNNDLRHLQDFLLKVNDLLSILTKLEKDLLFENSDIANNVKNNPIIIENIFTYFKEIRNIITHSHNYNITEIKNTKHSKNIIQIHFKFTGYTLEFIKNINDNIETGICHLQSVLSYLFDELIINKCLLHSHMVLYHLIYQNNLV